MLEIDWSKEFDSSALLVPLLINVVVLFAELDQVVSQDGRQVLAGLDNITGLLVAVVHLHVVPQVCLLAEAPVADLALVGPGPGVYIHVALQIPGGGEGFGTQQALVRLLLENKIYQVSKFISYSLSYPDMCHFMIVKV